MNFFLINEKTITFLSRLKTKEQAAAAYPVLFDLLDMEAAHLWCKDDNDWYVIDPHCNWNREENPLHRFNLEMGFGISQARLDRAIERIEELEGAISDFQRDHDNALSKAQRYIEEIPSADDLPSDSFTDEED